MPTPKDANVDTSFPTIALVPKIFIKPAVTIKYSGIYANELPSMKWGSGGYIFIPFTKSTDQ